MSRMGRNYSTPIKKIPLLVELDKMQQRQVLVLSSFFVKVVCGLEMHVLKVHSVDKPGVVAAVATSLAQANCNIEESAQFNDHLTGLFYMRVVISALGDGAIENFNTIFAETAKEFDAMTWELRLQDEAIKTCLLVSKADHCLNDILYRWRTKHLNIEICAVISNHEVCRPLVESYGLPFYCLPAKKADQESRIVEIVESTNTELIILARYMQIISEDLCTKYEGRIINIHHSFLPSFKGARPYHQAYERGVKIIGATAHFATSDLDEGPIIEQDIVRIDHSYEPKKLQVLGKDTEAKVLARAIVLYTERRIFLHGGRTVIL